jgi:hypothetical protein
VLRREPAAARGTKSVAHRRVISSTMSQVESAILRTESLRVGVERPDKVGVDVEIGYEDVSGS